MYAVIFDEHDLDNLQKGSFQFIRNATAPKPPSASTGKRMEKKFRNATCALCGFRKKLKPEIR